jgi:hypothetical protein
MRSNEFPRAPIIPIRCYIASWIPGNSPDTRWGRFGGHNSQYFRFYKGFKREKEYLSCSKTKNKDIECI